MNNVQINIHKDGRAYLANDDLNSIKFDQLCNYLDVKLSYEKKDKYYIQKFSTWDGKVRLFNKNYKSFPVGLVEQVLKCISAFSPEIQYDIFDFRPPVETYKLFPNKLLNVELRPYQQDAVKALLNHKIGKMQWYHGLMHMPTGSGKTVVAAEIIRQLQMKTLFLVHTKDLLIQATDMFEKYLGIKCGIIQGSTCDVKLVTVGMVQTIYKNLFKYKPLLSTFGCVMADECHRTAADMFYKTISVCTSSKAKIGFSGTVHRDDGEDMMIEAAIGKVIYSVKTNELINQHYLVQPIVTFLELSEQVIRGNYSEVYNQYIVNNTERNNLIKLFAENEAKKGAVLILVEKIKHGKLLEQMIDGSKFVYGAITSKNRKLFIQDIQSGNLQVIIATKIFDEGVDITALKTLILACGGKSSIKVIQRSGRVLRLFEGKEYAKIYDFVDKAKYLYGHYKRRRLIMEQANNFVINKVS